MDRDQYPSALRKRAKWLKAHPFTLPDSGHQVLVRDVTEMDLVAANLNSSALQTIVDLWTDPNLAKRAQAASNSQEVEHFRKMVLVLDAYVRAALIWPAPVETPDAVTDDESTVYLGDLSFADKLALMSRANGGEAATTAAMFPHATGGTEAGVEPVHDSQDPEPAPVTPDADSETAGATVPGL